MKIAPLYPFASVYDGPKKKHRWCFVMNIYLGPSAGVITQCGGTAASSVDFLEPEEMVNAPNFCIECRRQMVERGLIKE